MNNTATSGASLYYGRPSTRFPARASLPRWRFTTALLALLLGVGFLAFADRASAQVTYSVFQATGPDVVNSGDTATISGNITVSGTGIDPTITSYNFTLTSSDGSVLPVSASSSTPGEPAPDLGSGTLTATPTGLILSANGDIQIQAGGVTGGNPYVSAEWEPENNALNMFAGTLGPPATIQLFNTSASTTSGLGAAPWTIATAIPEPRSEALALLGIPALLLLKRKRSAAAKSV